MQTFNSEGGRAQDMRIIENPREPLASNILGLSAGINDYASHRKNTTGTRAFGDLTSAVKDARELRERLLTYRGPDLCFPDGRIDLRLDSDARREDLQASLAGIAKRASGSGRTTSSTAAVVCPGTGAGVGATTGATGAAVAGDFRLWPRASKACSSASPSCCSVSTCA